MLYTQGLNRTNAIFNRPSLRYDDQGNQINNDMPWYPTTITGFYKGIMIEEGTINYIPVDSNNDGLPDGMSNWNRRGISPAIREGIITSGIPGIALHIKDTSASTQVNACQTIEGYATINENIAGLPFTLSFYVKGTYTGCYNGTVVLQFYNSSGIHLVTSYIPSWNVTSDVSRIIFTATAPANSVKIHIAIYLVEGLDTGDAYEIWCGGLQVEQKSYATSWQNPINRTRAPELLSFSTNGLNPTLGTFEFWYYEDGIIYSRVRYMFFIPNVDQSNGLFIIYKTTSGKVTFRTRNENTSSYSDASTPGIISVGWHRIRAVYSPIYVILYIDGELIQMTDNPALPTAINETGYIGNYNNISHANMMFDDIRISLIERTVNDDFGLTTPLPIDQNTLLKFNCDENLYSEYVFLPGLKSLYNSMLYERGWFSGERIISMEVDFELGFGAVATINWTATTPGTSRVSAFISINDKVFWTEMQNGISLFFLMNTQQAGRKIFWIKFLLESASMTDKPYISTATVEIDQIGTAYRLAYDVLTDAGLNESEYFIDAALLEYYIPYAWLFKSSHKQALKQIIKFVLGNCYTDRSNRIHIDGPEYIKSLIPQRTVAARNYFPGRKLLPVNGQIPSQVEIYGNPLVPTDRAEEVYRLNAQSLQAGEANTFTCFYTTFYTQNPVFDCSATLELAPTGTIITNQEYFTWGAKITVSTNIDCLFNLVISGYPLKVKGRFHETVFLGNTATVDTGENVFYERKLYGTRLYTPTKDLSLAKSVSYTHPSSHLIQTHEIARKIADTLLQKFSSLGARMELPYTGDPSLEFDDWISLKNLRDDGLKEYIIKTHEIKFENNSLRGKVVLNNATDWRNDELGWSLSNGKPSKFTGTLPPMAKSTTPARLGHQNCCCPLSRIGRRQPFWAIELECCQKVCHCQNPGLPGLSPGALVGPGPGRDSCPRTASFAFCPLESCKQLERRDSGDGCPGKYD